MKKQTINWHTAFASGIELEFRENRDDLNYIKEHILNKKALQIDMIVIKKKPGIKLKNELGNHFRTHNIVEFKSANDDLNIDTLFKLLAYACLYKSYGSSADAIPYEEITLTTIRERKPSKLFKYIIDHDGQVVERGHGIYDIIWKIPFSVRIIINKDLDFDNHTWLAAIRDNLSKEKLLTVIQKSRFFSEKCDIMNVDAVMEIISLANTENLELAKKEDLKMCKTLIEIMRPEIDAEVEKGVKEGISKAVDEAVSKAVDEAVSKAIDEAVSKAVDEAVSKNTFNSTLAYLRNLMETMSWTAEQAMTALKIPAEQATKYVAML